MRGAIGRGRDRARRARSPRIPASLPHRHPPTTSRTRPAAAAAAFRVGRAVPPPAHPPAHPLQLTPNQALVVVVAQVSEEDGAGWGWEARRSPAAPPTLHTLSPP